MFVSSVAESCWCFYDTHLLNYAPSWLKSAEHFSYIWFDRSDTEAQGGRPDMRSGEVRDIMLGSDFLVVPAPFVSTSLTSSRHPSPHHIAIVPFVSFLTPSAWLLTPVSSSVCVFHAISSHGRRRVLPLRRPRATARIALSAFAATVRSACEAISGSGPLFADAV